MVYECRPEVASRTEPTVGVTVTVRSAGPSDPFRTGVRDSQYFEYCSEDPLLTARTTVGFVRGVQSAGMAATVKHFVGNDTRVLGEGTQRVFAPGYAHVGHPRAGARIRRDAVRRRPRRRTASRSLRSPGGPGAPLITPPSPREDLVLFHIHGGGLARLRTHAARSRGG
ncbi:hypothetical protein FNH08_05065 [Streptomyces spongiae]|uniref:Uncharacterized protein n=1 Tax=Streptomyces spongiae TaxID=565072 RepID=A0A5N8XAQ3_9ACTN|nr:hypothetical protein [Streptomyces spongiae]